MSTSDDIFEGYILDTTNEEMNVISSSNSLLPPAVRTASAVSLINVAGKNTTNHYCKHSQSKYSETTNNIIHQGRVNIVNSYKAISEVVGYYVFFLRRIRL